MMLVMAPKLTVTLLAAILTTTFTLASEKATVSPEREVLRGRVMAEVASLATGAGLGPKWVSFIFAVESSSGKVIPVRIAYAFYKAGQLPPDSFWDYSKSYELNVERDPTCDTTVQAISFDNNVDEYGDKLPATLVLQPAKNAPPNSLKLDSPLPCYVLWHGRYKQVGTTAPR
jgi:hypothetical protein